MRPIAGGVFITLGILIGTVTGIVIEQVTIGLLSGLAAGVLCAVAVALYDAGRRRRK